MPRKKSMEVDIKPAVLNWAIQSSGWKKEELIKKLEVSGEIFSKWLSGEKKLTLIQLRALAKQLKRPLAAFLLPAPPEDKKLPEDFRMPSYKAVPLSKEVLLAIRRARRLQTISKELLTNINQSKKPEVNAVKISDDAKKIAEEERKLSEINMEVQSKWKSPHKAFKSWRECLEAKNIIVFQTKMPPEEVRGLSLIDEEPYIIVISSDDNPYARIFTLLHEYAHILLKTQGICKPEEQLIYGPHYSEIEMWCDSFAGNFLMPIDAFEADIKSLPSGNLTNRDVLVKLSNKYSVSKAAILTKMRILEKISKTEYENKMNSYKKEEEKPVVEVKEKETKVMRLPLDKQCIRDKGNKFISLVIENVNLNHITNNDALDYLSIKLRHWNKMLQSSPKIKNEPT